MSTNIKDRKKYCWNNHLACLSDAGVKPALFTWYVGHYETFIRTQQDTRLRQHNKNSVTRSLSRLVNNEHKPAWQNKQAIHAIQLMFKSIHAPLYREIDWPHWQSSCHDLPADHDANYQINYPVKLASCSPGGLCQRQNIQSS